MSPNILKTILARTDSQKIYFLFSSSSFFDKQEVYKSVKQLYLTQNQNYTLNRLQKTLTQTLIEYPQSSACFLAIEEISADKKKIILCGLGDFTCQITKVFPDSSKDYFLPIEKKGLSGYLGSKDKIVINFQKYNPSPGVLSPQSEINSEPQTLPLIDDVPKVQSQISRPNLIKPFLSRFKIIPQIFHNLKFPPKPKPEKPILNPIDYRKYPPITKKRLIALSLASFFLILLGFSIGFGVAKKRKFELEQYQKQLTTDITYRLSQAESLKDLNPQRAKTLLAESLSILKTYQKNNTLNEELQILSDKVNQTYGEVAQIYHISPELFYNTSLIKDNLTITSLSLTNESLYLFDNQAQTLISLDLAKKSGQILAANPTLNSSSQITSNDNWVIIKNNNLIQLLNPETGKVINSFELNTLNLNQVIGYSANLYGLDKAGGQLWRFQGQKDSLSKAQAFFNEVQDFNNINSFALDGSLWLLDSDGGVHKYTQGIKDAYFPDFDLDEPLLSPEKIFTNEYCEDLYILDRQNSRILTISKDGIYQGQYLNSEIKEFSDFVVSEQIGKILLVKGDKIFSINLK